MSDKQNYCECGMLTETPNEYHTFAYCLAFKVLLNRKDVIRNMEFTVKNHPQTNRLTEQLATAREALKKYSDQKNWGCSNCYDSAVNCGPSHAQDVWIRGDESGSDIGDEALAAIDKEQT